MTSSCAVCRKPFQAHRSTARYCGSTCRTAASRARRATEHAADVEAAQQPPTPAGDAPGTGAGQLEQLLTRGLQAQGWSTDLVTPAGFLGAMALDMARFQDQMAPGQNKAANNRELRLTLTEFRALSQSVGGSAVEDDQEPDQQSGRAAGAADPGGAQGGDVVPFGRRGAEAG